MTLSDVLALCYVVALSGLALYGFLGLVTLFLYRRHRHDPSPHPEVSAGDLPPVTIQLPLFNERYVVDRLLAAVTSLRYPPGRLQIQVIDDSVDDTTARAAELVEGYRRQGVEISLVRRNQRIGYKAGALANALRHAEGEFVAIFDADFQPGPDFLYRTIPHFLTTPELGMVQARWGHLNAADSLLTSAQALALDKHFAVEQTVRHRADMFPKFNGTAGVWRRACLEDAGGWQADTVCEDLCLSTRAILRGWRFRFLPDVVAPAELPATVSAYKNQQARWAKGSTQCLMKFGRAILSSDHRLSARLYGVLSMSAYMTSLLLILLLLLQLPLVYLDYSFPPWLLIYSIAGLGQPLLFLLGQQVLYHDWWRRLPHLPALLLTAIGLSVTISRAVLEAALVRDHTFVRTPKQGSEGLRARRAYRLPFDPAIVVEGALAMYAGTGLAIALARGNFGPSLFLLSCLLGFGYVALAGIAEQLA